MTEMAQLLASGFSTDAHPQARTDLIVRFIDNESVVWSPVDWAPIYLDPVATLLFRLLDGAAAIAELITDVHEVVGVPLSVARNHIDRSIGVLHRAGLLESSPRPEVPDVHLDLFPAPPNP